MEQRNEQLWRMAQKRAGFQRSLVAYALVNGLLWFIWWFSTARHGEDAGYWPIWPMIGWGIGLAFQYVNAYGGSKTDLVQKEYDRLRSKQQGG